MADRYTQVVILCEDLMHFNFLRRFLMRRGIEGRRIRGQVSPKGRGAGSQFVMDNFPTEVQSIRSRPFIRAGLIAIVDADTCSVADRLRHIEQSLEKCEQEKRKPGERIAVLSPKRNVETWIFHLRGNETNEEDDYKHRISPSDIQPSVAVFTAMCPGKCETIVVPSLRHACEELTAFLACGQ